MAALVLFEYSYTLFKMFSWTLRYVTQKISVSICESLRNSFDSSGHQISNAVDNARFLLPVKDKV